MNKWSLGAAVVAVVSLVGASSCSSVADKVDRERIAGATLHFTPDVAKGNIPSWWYQFKTDGSQVLACNLKPARYTGTGWTLDEEARTVKVTFGSDWEKYTLTADDDSFEEGRFEYEASLGSKYDMVGKWERVSSAPCMSGSTTGSSGTSDAGTSSGSTTGCSGRGSSTFTGTFGTPCGWSNPLSSCKSTSTTRYSYRCDQKTCTWQGTDCGKACAPGSKSSCPGCVTPICP